MSKYEELQKYLPDFYENISEMNSYLQSLGAEMDSLSTGTIQMRDNNFIMLADESTIRRWEKFLYITYDSTKTLDDRRRQIVSYLIGSGKIGAAEIKALLRIFTELPCTIAFHDATVFVEVYRDTINDTFNVENFRKLLLKRLPAHLKLDITTLNPIASNIYTGVLITEYRREEILIGG